MADLQTKHKQHRMLGDATESLDFSSTLIPEIEALFARLKPKLKAPNLTGLPSLIHGLQRERDNLDQVAAQLRGGDLAGDQLKACDKRLYPSCTAINHAHLKWCVIKRCSSFVSVQQNFQGSSKEDRRGEISQRGAATGREKHLLHRSLKEKGRVQVDVVDGGAEWIDVRALSLNRLARHMTDAGWDWGHGSGDGDIDPDEWETVPLAQQVRRLITAARMNRHEYMIPRIRVVLPNIGRSDDEDVAAFLEQLELMDQTVQVRIEDRDSRFLMMAIPLLETAVENLAGNDFAGLTPTLNLDHTILVDLISDITHLQLEPQPWQAPTTQAQIEDERQHEGGCMARTLYPLLRGRQLVCTREAAEHFHDVLSTVGTKTERQRGHLLIPKSTCLSHDDIDDIRAQFISLSAYPPPPDVQLPITILPTSWDDPKSITTAVETGRLPCVALDVARCGGFRSSKLSIYMHGWAENIVTVTSNKEIRGQIRTWVEANRKDDADRGPQIYRVDVTRNLLAKSATPPEGWEE